MSPVPVRHLLPIHASARPILTWLYGESGPSSAHGLLRDGSWVSRLAQALYLTRTTVFEILIPQGPGEVVFSESEIRMDVAEGAATTTATFSQPGSYVVRVQAINDLESGRNPTYGFEFHCCWTNGFVRVEVVE